MARCSETFDSRLRPPTLNRFDPLLPMTKALLPHVSEPFLNPQILFESLFNGARLPRVKL